MLPEVFIIEAKRTPLGGFLGALSAMTAIDLGAEVTNSLFHSQAELKQQVQSLFMGNVLSANLGQAPARQVALASGLPQTTRTTTINKVCASGMKAIHLAAQEIQLGISQLVVAVGAESMSNVPFYAPLRSGHKFGHFSFTDGLLKDGLTDAYHGSHMGNAAETTVRKYGISRSAQDRYAIASYQKALSATKSGKFNREIIAIDPIPGKGKDPVTSDEDIFKLKEEKVAQLRATFEENGTITAANASNLNDGAAALLLASAQLVEEYGLKPIGKLVAYADAEQAPEDFSTSPALAIQQILTQKQLSIGDIDFFEINEAYASVVLANAQILDIPERKINRYGGAIALGHPLGASGARIATTLLSVLKQEAGHRGIAAICNGGGGASAILIETL